MKHEFTSIVLDTALRAHVDAVAVDTTEHLLGLVDERLRDVYELLDELGVEGVRGRIQAIREEMRMK